MENEYEKNHIIITGEPYEIAEKVIKGTGSDFDRVILSLKCAHGGEGKRVTDVYYTLAAYSPSRPDGNDWYGPDKLLTIMHEGKEMPVQISDELSKLEKILLKTKTFERFKEYILIQKEFFG